MALLHAKSYVVANRPTIGVAWQLGEGVPPHVSSSSSDLCSKFRGPSQNSTRGATKQDVNITKYSMGKNLEKVLQSQPLYRFQQFLFLKEAYDVWIWH
ncbi:hypothetical protein AVEN_123467-1 [Araneus ventricosus]|uniref:Uncharacterized protein n=1 Tax=Araneus ventricosus TaxID=182803 RepID=A0A4Y2UV73_ARAVE|nr:hypothetical protein AVEN_123467-1 [Araneus ventricosus]